MEEYQIRVVEEKESLDLKIKNLQSFVENAMPGKNMTPHEKQDLGDQLRIMKQYQAILQSRINRF